MNVLQGLRRAVQINHDGYATIDGERRQTWGALMQRVAKLAGALSKLGLQTGGRVAILAFNSDCYLEYYFAVPWAGGIIVPLNTRLAPPELVYMLNDAGVEILVVDEAHKAVLPALTTGADAIRHVILIGDSDLPSNAVRHEEIIAAADSVSDAGRGGDDVLGIFYTGGTTGLPKGVMLSHNNLICNSMASLLQMHDGDPLVFLHSAPMFHIADCQWVVGATLEAGTHVFTPKFVPEEMLKLIESYRITHCALVPTMVLMLCNVAHKVSADVSSLRRMNYGGSPMSPAIIARAREVFPRCQFIQGYGQTETSPNISMLPDKYHTETGEFSGKVESAGQPIFTMEVQIVDENDHEVPRGQIGEIVTRGPNVMVGYWNKPKETAHALRGGWMHTGDAGFMDDDGFLFIVDRIKDVIISGGENVYSVEVEHVLYQHPAVAMCAVIGIPDETWGESVHAIVV